MTYKSREFRFPMGEAGKCALRNTVFAVTDYVRYASNQGGDETDREHIRSAFYILRSRLDRGESIQSATGDLERIADSFRDM